MKNLILKTLLISSLVAAPAIANDQLTGEKIGKMKKHFAKIDTDGSGTISKSEFLVRAEEKFKKIDSNGDGEITKEERKAAHQHFMEKRQQRKREIEG